MIAASCLLVVLSLWLWTASPHAIGWRPTGGLVALCCAALLGVGLMRLGPRWLVVGAVLGTAAWSVHRLWSRVRRRRATGATAEGCARALLAAGAAQVTLAVVARVTEMQARPI